MFCPQCGTQNDDHAYQCVSCGQPLRAQSYESVPNYLVPAILVTVFCCLPFGIVAIVYAAQVNGKAQAGDIAGAQEYSNKAKMWSWIAFGTGLFVSFFWFAVTFLGAMFAS